LIGGAR